MLSANPIATTLPASSCSVQCVCPSGASLQAMATKCASCLPSNLRLCPGRGRSMSALSSPSCTYRVRTRPTVDALINSPLAMSRSIRPSSAFSNTSARLTLRAEVSPRLAICPRCLRSDSLNSTLYLRAGMSSYVLLIGSYTRLTYLLYLSNTPRHGTSPFEDVADQIIAEIQRRQPRAGRSLFLLDQTGFAQVQLSLVSRIFDNLPMAEVILTFAKDHLLNRLSTTKALIKAVAPLDISEQQMDIWTELKEGSNDNEWRALIQRGLRGHIRNRTGATYDTPFFIRPQQSRLALWFLHLSRHPTARDVMIQCHWSSSNTFEHYGSGGFDMLGWDALKAGQLPLFNFTEFDSIKMREELLDSMPPKLFTLSAEYPITVDAMRHMLANETAARFSDYDDVVLQLAREREVKILNPDGKVRTRNLKRLSPTDRIAIPDMRLFPGISRLQ